MHLIEEYVELAGFEICRKDPIYRPLADLLTVTYGPLPVLNREFSGIDGIDFANIFGSWAARYEGVPGAIPVDVDLLVVGAADRDLLETAA